MQPLLFPDLRNNLGTWAVMPARVPAVTGAMFGALPPEPFDAEFRGQVLRTSYFDTANFALRRARRQGVHYLTLRLRGYDNGRGEFYALSAKSENFKFRREVEPAVAAAVLAGDREVRWNELLPPDLFARLLDLTGGHPIAPVVTVAARRYAVEDDADRLTLDVEVETDTGKRLPTAVLEFKSTLRGAEPPLCPAQFGLRPIKLSKFLWATLWR